MAVAGPENTAVGSSEPASGTQDGQSSRGKSLGKAILRIVVSGLLLAVVPLLAASETSIKDLISGWFEDCRLIIDIEPAEFVEDKLKTIIPVTIYATGNNSPDEIRLAFSTKTQVLEKVLLDRDLTADNLAIHPNAGESCPGRLCPGQAITSDSTEAQTKGARTQQRHRDLTIELKHFSSIFNYPFKVYLFTAEKPEINSDMISVYVHYKKDSIGPSKTVCGAESASIFNKYSRVGPWWQFGILTVFLIVLTGLVTLLRHWSA